jgi:hypothetical protein
MIFHMIKNTEPLDTSPYFINVDAFVITKNDKPKSKTDIDAIVRNAICEHYNITWTEINVKSRKTELKRPRQGYFYFMRKYTEPFSYSLSRIGKALGKDHATVLHSVRTWINLKETEIRFAMESNMIEQAIKLALERPKEVIVETEETIANWEKIKHKYIVG